MDPVEQVGVENAGLWNRSEGQGDDHLLPARFIVAWKSE